jgi:alpha-tubulin suppressor-like RCC1 family protein
VLAQRRRGTAGGKGVVTGGGGGSGAGSLLWWGNEGEGAGFEKGGPFLFPQGTLNLANVVQMWRGLALDSTNRVYTWGKNLYGNQGLGTKGTESEGFVTTPTPIIGGIPMWQEEHFEEKGVPFTQPLGPIGPIVPPILAIAAGAQNRSALTGVHTTAAGFKNPITNAPIAINKRVMAWGALPANGYAKVTATGAKTESPQKAWEGGQWKPMSYAPNWVFTGPGPVTGPGTNEQGQGIEKPDGSNVLSGVKAIDCAHGNSVALMENGSVYTWGDAVGGEKQLYATKDDVWEAARGGQIPTAITTNFHNYAVIMPGTGQVRVVGVGAELWEGTFGDGATGSKTVRTVHTPTREVSPGVFVPLDKVVAIACGQYFYIALKDDGTVWTWGSNRAGQLGQGLAYASYPTGTTQTWAIGYHPAEVTALHPGARRVVAITAGGKEEEEAFGSTGGDTGLVLMDDATIRTWGKQYLLVEGRSNHGTVTGALGDGTGMTRNSPVNPSAVFPQLSGIKAIAASSRTMLVSVPSNPPGPSLSVTNPTPGTVRVEWREVPGTEGTWPLWRKEEGWRVKLTGGPGGNHDSGPLPSSGFSTTEKGVYDEVKPGTNTRELGSGCHVFTFTGVLAGAWALVVNGTSQREEPAITGGPTQTASGGKLLVAWANPVLPFGESGYYVEWHRESGAEKDKAHGTLTQPGAIGELNINVSETANLKATVLLKVGGTETPGTGEYVVVSSVDKAANEVFLEEPLEQAHSSGEGVWIVSLTEDVFTRSPLLPSTARSYLIELEPSAHGLTNENLTLRVRGTFYGTFQSRTVHLTTA